MSDWLKEYSAAVESGEVVAGAEMRALLERLAAERADPRFTYDTAAAERTVGFIQSVVRLTKSPWYGRPMVLLPWQKAFIEAFYSFRMASDGVARFRRALLLTGRKNAKTELCAALAFDALVNGPPGSDVVCSGNDDGDASILRDTVDKMRQMADPAGRVTHRNNRFISNLRTGSQISKLTQRTKSKEGRSIDLAVVDEVHGMRDGEVVNAIWQSMSLKPEPRLILITTEGFTEGGFLDRELAYARQVLAGEADDEDSVRYLPWLYTQDSEQEVWADEKSWEKSNPSIDVIKPRGLLRQQVARARTSRPDRAYVLCKEFNLKTGAAEAWLRPEDYSYDASFDAAGFRGAVCLGAADLAETTDLACVKALLMRPGDDRRYVLTRYFIPESKLSLSPDEAAGADYAAWARAGWLEVAPGADVDVAACADWFYGLYAEHGIRPLAVGYDSRFARGFRARLDDYGIDHEVIEQSAASLNAAVRTMEADLGARRLVFNNNPVDRWCLGNAALKVNDMQQALIVKPGGRAAWRVDGAVAFAILYETYRRHRAEFDAAVSRQGF